MVIFSNYGKTKPQAQRVGPGRYTYRCYVIEEVSHDAGQSKPHWIISVAGKGPCDAASTLRDAKLMIDGWWEMNSHVQPEGN